MGGISRKGRNAEKLRDHGESQSPSIRNEKKTADKLYTSLKSTLFLSLLSTNFELSMFLRPIVFQLLPGDSLVQRTLK